MKYFLCFLNNLFQTFRIKFALIMPTSECSKINVKKLKIQKISAIFILKKRTEIGLMKYKPQLFGYKSL